MSSDPLTVRGQLIPPTRRGEVYQVKVICPYCGKPHFHGAGPDGTRLGWRKPDCGRGPQYCLAVETREQ
jgi:hypothetical protein